MKLSNPLKKKTNLWQKISQSWPFTSKSKKQKKFLNNLLNFLLYISIFLAGFTLAKIHSLFMLID